MIEIFTGNNSYSIKDTLNAETAEFDGAVERVDGVDIDLNRLADLLAGGGLFAEKKIVFIDELSKNKSIWPVFSDWVSRVDDDTRLILVEPKLDKRTSTYKALKSTADIKEFNNWTDRDQVAATKWTIEQAGKRGLQLDRGSAAELVRRSMVVADKPGRMDIDQWRLHHGIEKLRAVDNVTPDVVVDLIDAEPHENSFEILELALSGRSDTLQERIGVLRQTEDPYRLFGLLANQAYQLAVLAHADKSVAGVAADLKVHPYPLEKLQPLARKLGRSGAKKLIATMADTDLRLKSSGHDAWHLVENTLLGLGHRL